ncbi:MAG: RNA methyltransferase [Burkholderiales bacterium]|nr:RNA methyltransferase [Burkholderiales bacterium]
MSLPSVPTSESNAPSLLANVRVVLCQTSHPGNIGACARAMKTMGLHQLVLVNPKFFPHPEAEAMASRATDVLESARVCENLDQALTGTVYAAASTARQRDLSHAVLSPREAAARLMQEARHGPVALVMGAEKYGLTAEEVNRCSVITMVPASPEYSSLNLAAAVQVFAYELRLAALAPALPQQVFEPATHEELERFYTHLERMLLDVGFLDPVAPRRLMQRMRRLFARAHLEREEVSILRGILAAAQEAARKERKVD